MLGIGLKLKTNNSNVRYQSPQRQRRKEGSRPLLPAGFGKGFRDSLQGALQARWDGGLDRSSGTRPRDAQRPLSPASPAQNPSGEGNEAEAGGERSREA